MLAHILYSKNPYLRITANSHKKLYLKNQVKVEKCEQLYLFSAPDIFSPIYKHIYTQMHLPA